MSSETPSKLWKKTPKVGRKKKYSPTTLWKKFLEYVEWVEQNPLMETVVVQKGIQLFDPLGEPYTAYTLTLPKMRPYTLTGFEVFADISAQTWSNYKKEKEFLEVLTRIEHICFTQKFEGAAAGFFNANIIARDLGLVDKSSTELKVEQPLFSKEKPTQKK